MLILCNPQIREEKGIIDSGAEDSNLISFIGNYSIQC